MENKKALKLIDKILTDLEKSGINTDTLIEDLKALRSYALEQQVPLVVKVLRLTYEHIEENDSFLIPIPDDEPIEEQENENEAPVKNEDVNPVESLMYLVSLFKDIKNKMNVMDLADYRDALNA
ncbi:hypothetical protein D1818_01665 [Aquimarina sp. BL5]|uniref:hypothetical protein n=1 Tax=Aquimarina sp. BL5 TaxID=1714860 RepID=UPI000E4B6A35|nr:hypothetical protein [Aquimarina sp. BL5]AXT49586.1 hypothetical protein D1818_01665 [Aquimarina sp. BL5]RKM93479.1 hypothetical protein D7036_22240 [Aquimarina sp. BL5]